MRLGASKSEKNTAPKYKMDKNGYYM